MDHEGMQGDEPLRRRRRGPSRLYVLARQSAAPWAQLRRLGPDDRERLLRHLLFLRQQAPAEVELAQRFCAALDPARTPGFVAVARGEIIAAAIALDLRPGGLGAAVTLSPAWRGRGLRRMLSGQLEEATGTAPESPLPLPLCLAMAGVVQRLGGRLVPPDRLGEDWVCEAEPEAAAG